MFSNLGLGNLIGNHAHNNYGHNSSQNMFNSGMSPQQAAMQYNNLLAQTHMNPHQQKVNWIFNGKICTVREMADEIWHNDCPEKTHFLLKYE